MGRVKVPPDTNNIGRELLIFSLRIINYGRFNIYLDMVARGGVLYRHVHTEDADTTVVLVEYYPRMRWYRVRIE